MNRIVKVVFRTDASLQMGSGHVMRCLTLADALTAHGADCQFISRQQPGHLLDLIRLRGYKANMPLAFTQPAEAAIKIVGADAKEGESVLPHAAWLGCDWQIDAGQTADILATLQPDWLVVDHYALDQRWESAVKPHCKKIMVIDDLADRTHRCDLLLDQNWFGNATPTRYRDLVPPHCPCYLGPEYALLQPEYAQLRAAMPPRDGKVRRVLVFLGGSDPSNQTSKVLTALTQPGFAHLQVDIVLGTNHPDVDGIAAQVAMRSGTTLHQALPTLAPFMAQADLMISAGGSTTWERMCLGLPSIVISIADNQNSTNVALMNAGYIDFLGEMSAVNVDIIQDAVQRYLDHPTALIAQSTLGQKLVSGAGASVICQWLLGSIGLKHDA